MTADSITASRHSENALPAPPNLEGFRARATAPTLRAAFLFALGLLAAFFPLALAPGLAFAWDVAVVIATLTDWVWLRRARVDARLELPRVQSLGRVDPVELIVRNVGPVALRGSIVQPAVPEVVVEGDGRRPADLAAEHGPVLDLHLAPGANAVFRLRLRPRVRGRRILPPAVARIRGPLGLAARRVLAGPSPTVAVYPDLSGVPKAELAVRASRILEGGTRPVRALGLGTEFDALRDYHPDDDVRRINWHATARTGRPISNEYRVEQDRIVMLLLDTGRLMAGALPGPEAPGSPPLSRPLPPSAPLGSRGGPDDVTRLDVAFGAAVALGHACDRVGDRVGALAFDSEPRRRLTPGRHRLPALLSALLDLQPRPVESDYLRAFSEVEGTKRSLVVLFTDLLDSAAARPLLAAAPFLARRHQVIVVSALDPDLDAAAGAVPRSVDEAYRRAAASLATEDRRRAAARLRALGALVIEAPPGAVGPGLVDAYLKVKRTGRL